MKGRQREGMTERPFNTPPLSTLECGLMAGCWPTWVSSQLGIAIGSHIAQTLSMGVLKSTFKPTSLEARR